MSDALGFTNRDTKCYNFVSSEWVLKSYIAFTERFLSENDCIAGDKI